MPTGFISHSPRALTQSHDETFSQHLDLEMVTKCLVLREELFVER